MLLVVDFPQLQQKRVNCFEWPLTKHQVAQRVTHLPLFADGFYTVFKVLVGLNAGGDRAK